MERRGSVLDRRSGKDRRRNVLFLGYFWNGGIERRAWRERREGPERRAAWVRVGPWYSIYPWDFEGLVAPQLSVISKGNTERPAKTTE